MSRYDTNFEKMGLDTRAIKVGEGVDPVTKALNTPIYETSTYGYETAEQYDEMLARGATWEEDLYIYSRTTNPTTDAVENSSENQVSDMGNSELQQVVVAEENAVIESGTEQNENDAVIQNSDEEQNNTEK